MHGLSWRILAPFGAMAMVATAAAPAHATTELVTNGGFETGDFSGFGLFGDQTNDNVVNYLVSYPASGDYQAVFGTLHGLSGITQTLATVAGESYVLSFDLALSDHGPSIYQVVFGNTLVAAEYDAEPFGYTHFSYHLTADSDSTLLRFSFRNDPGFFRLDNVSVTGVAGAAVPEPASWALFIAGFALAGAALRRRRTATAHRDVRVTDYRRSLTAPNAYA